jgi:aspartyl-tRNA(Asn)/glutamyl-tRNA(Gln) amidotransferase subunit B
LDGAIKIALMLACKINPDVTFFQRKHYDYPDLSSGYQKTSIPIGFEGDLNGVRIREVHVEEDPGQYKPDLGLVDFNRSGIPLIEIVTEPDMRSPEEARKFLRELIRVLEYSESARGEGTMRADVNISIEGGKRAEIKNVNSIKGAYKALQFEMVRQKNLLKRGIEIKQETRAFLESQMITVPMRLKEEADDYRYIPDPDLPPMLADEERVEYIREEMPEPAHIKTDRFVKQYGIKKDDAQVLTSELELADAFEEVVKEVDPEFAALWMRDELKRILSFNKITYKESEITSAQLVEFFKLLLDKKITTKAGQRIIENLPHNPKSPTLIAEDLGLIGVVEEDVVQQAVKQSIEENPEAVSDYYQGKKKALNFLMGQVMRITQGKADPGDIIKLLKGELDK